MNIVANLTKQNRGDGFLNYVKSNQLGTKYLKQKAQLILFFVVSFAIELLRAAFRPSGPYLCLSSLVDGMMNPRTNFKKPLELPLLNAFGVVNNFIRY